MSPTATSGSSDSSRDVGDFAKKLDFAIQRTGRDRSEFIAGFQKASNIRRATILEYVAGVKVPYGATLEKFVDYLRPSAPALSVVDFTLGYDEFVRRFEAAMALRAAAPQGSQIPLSMSILSSEDMAKLTGSWRVFRYASDDDPRVMSEALSISPVPRDPANGAANMAPTALRARLWTTANDGRQCFEGFAVVAGQQVSLLLAHSTGSTDLMRTLVLRPYTKFGAEGERKLDGKTGDRALSGIMTGSLGNDPVRVGVAAVTAVRMYDRFDLAEDERSWRSVDADRDVTKDILLALGAARRG